jgi:hypothetical protein
MSMSGRKHETGEQRNRSCHESARGQGNAEGARGRASALMRFEQLRLQKVKPPPTSHWTGLLSLWQSHCRALAEPPLSRRARSCRVQPPCCWLHPARPARG